MQMCSGPDCRGICYLVLLFAGHYPCIVQSFSHFFLYYSFSFAFDIVK